MIKHISFDFWGTLFKSHPDYKIERAKIFYEHYNKNKLSLDEVNELVRKVEKAVDAEGMFTGNHISFENILFRILYKLGHVIKDKDVINIYDLMENIFYKYPPVYYDKDTLNVLKKMKNKYNLYLISNTGFIPGYKLTKHLSNLSIVNFFDKKTFSDEQKYYKPSKYMFERTFNFNYARGSAIHIGDSYAADGIGAENAGIKHIIINTNDLTIKDIPDLL